MHHNNIHGQCASVVEGTRGSEIKVDIGEFLQRILLFEKYTLSSIRLKELPILAKYLGIGGLKELLEHDCIDIHWEVLTTAQIGQTTALESRAKKGALPLFGYEFVMITLDQQTQQTERALKELKEINGINKKELKELKRLVRKKLVYFKKGSIGDIFTEFENHLMNTPLVTKAIICDLPAGTKLSDLEVDIKKINESEWEANTNICQLLSIDEQKGHKLIERSLLRLGGLSRRIHEMRDFDSLSGFNGNKEIELFKQRLKPLGEGLSETKLNSNFIKTLDIKNLPNFDEIIESREFSIEKLLKIRETKECKEFRSWLWSLKEPSEKEIEDRVSSLKAAAGNILTSKTGKVIRFAANTIAGILTPASIPLSAADTFLMEKIFKRDGVSAFINTMYPSLYE